MTIIGSDRVIDVTRAAAIVACIGLLYSPTVATIGLITAYVAFVVSGQALRRTKQIINRPLSYCGMVFVGFVLLGMTYATVPWFDRWYDVYKWRTILWFFVILAVFEDEQWKHRLLISFVMGTGVGVIGSFAMAAGWVTLWRNPNELLRNSGTQGMAFSAAALVCVWMVRNRKLCGWGPWLWATLAVIYIANVVFITDSRSGYAVLILGLGVLFSWQGSWKRSAVVFGILLMVSLVALSVSPRMQSKVNKAVNEWNNESELQILTSFGIRRVFATNTMEIIREHWLLGLGTGGFPQAYREHIAGKYLPADWRAITTGDPHNQYLAIFVEHGIGGLLIFLGWLLAIGLDRRGPPVYRSLAVALLAGWCITSLFSSHFRTFAEGHLFATFLGVLLAGNVRPDESQAAAASS